MGTKQSLSCLENHLVVDLEEFINKEPSAIGAEFGPIAVSKNPMPIRVNYRALQPRQRVVIELDIAVCHATNLDLAIVGGVGKGLVRTRTVQELQVNLRRLRLVVRCYLYHHV